MRVGGGNPHKHDNSQDSEATSGKGEESWGLRFQKQKQVTLQVEEDGTHLAGQFLLGNPETAGHRAPS